MVGVAVGDENGVHAFEAAPDARQQRPQATARNARVDEQAPSLRLDKRGIARATARKYAELQDRPPGIHP